MTNNSKKIINLKNIQSTISLGENLSSLIYSCKIFCIKGKCKYGQACYRKCVDHLRRFGHTPQVLMRYL